MRTVIALAAALALAACSTEEDDPALCAEALATCNCAPLTTTARVTGDDVLWCYAPGVDPLAAEVGPTYCDRTAAYDADCEPERVPERTPDDGEPDPRRP